MNQTAGQLLETAKNHAREEVEASVQAHAGRLAAIAAELENGYGVGLDARIQETRRELTEKLYQFIRRLREIDDASDPRWSSALLEATQGFCERAAVFLLKDGALHGAGMDPVPLGEAAAFAAAVESKDTVIALRTATEMSPQIAALFGEAADRTSSIFPVIAHRQVAALLYTGGEGDLELLAAIAGAFLERRPPPRPMGQPLHLRAQRFAKVYASRIRLHYSEAVKKSRAVGDLYTSLKAEMDAAREDFQRQFLSDSTGMVDYLHVEIVNTLADGDATLLGAEYPGPLI